MSPRAAAGDVAVLRATQLRDLDGLWLHLRCGCKSTTIATRLLASRHGRVTLGAVVDRLRCEGRCRERPSRVVLSLDQVPAKAYGQMMGSQPGWAVVLVGEPEGG